jgi:hypothetical protein
MATAKRICSISGCNKPIQARGWCKRHYQRWRNHGNPLAGRTFNGEPGQFLKIAVSHRGDECLIWPFSRNPAGYGNTSVNGRWKVVSRLVCELVNGAPPSDRHQAAHFCGKGGEGCVSGSHVRWVTPKENQADRYKHGTDAAGSKNTAAKLSEKEIVEIRSLIGRISQEKIAEKFGVTQTLISKIKVGKLWQHVALHAGPR